MKVSKILDFSEIDSVSDTGHLDEFVQKRPVASVLSDFETEENDVLVKRVKSFREL